MHQPPPPPPGPSTSSSSAIPRMSSTDASSSSRHAWGANSIPIPDNGAPPSQLNGSYDEVDTRNLTLPELRDNGAVGSKPSYPYATLIRSAINGAPEKRLLLEDIYAAIEGRFPYFTSAGNGWKNSIRHNLSLNPCFVKVARPLKDRGKGSYWTIDEDIDPATGVHRVRSKRYGKESKTTRRKLPEDGTHADELDTEPVTLPGPIAPQGTDPRVRPPFVAHDLPLLPVTDADEQIVWKHVWRNELTRLRLFSQDQDINGGSDQLWQTLVFGVRNTLSTLVPGDPQFHPGMQMHMQMQHQEESI
ncbi:hypothetical protein BKA62DRAFT_690349 [Auriculariales sp. MPI-PUGE-AT-0066]|nr:hypothetical protein BKA62DRAFT_690349 [Auriculariales sp. MPI-PUGE-AT-0066]